MRKICYYCGKGAVAGRVMSRKGQYKAKGGTGSKISRKTKRMILPNLQRLRAKVGGLTKSIFVCTKCLKSGKVTKP